MSFDRQPNTTFAVYTEHFSDMISRGHIRRLLTLTEIMAAVSSSLGIVIGFKDLPRKKKEMNGLASALSRLQQSTKHSYRGFPIVATALEMRQLKS